MLKTEINLNYLLSELDFFLKIIPYYVLLLSSGSSFHLHPFVYMLILNFSLTVPSSRMELNFEPRSSVLSYVRGRKRDRECREAMKEERIEVRKCSKHRPHWDSQL